MKSVKLAAIAALALLGGCTLNKEYVAADKGTYDHVVPIFTKYVKEDPKLDTNVEERARILRLIESWRIRIATARGETP